MNEAERAAALRASVSVLACFSPALGDHLLERPSVHDQVLLDGRLVERGIHGLAEVRMADAAARSVHFDGCSVEDDPH